MPRVGFEPTIPVFERANTVHALDRAPTVIGLLNFTGFNKVHAAHLYTLWNFGASYVEEMVVLKKWSTPNKHDTVCACNLVQTVKKFPDIYAAEDSLLCS
jgi:hypothetical protein